MFQFAGATNLSRQRIRRRAATSSRPSLEVASWYIDLRAVPTVICVKHRPTCFCYQARKRRSRFRQLWLPIFPTKNRVVLVSRMSRQQSRIHKDSLVNILSSESQRRFGQMHVSMDKVEFTRLALSWAKCFAVSARSNLSWAKYVSVLFRIEVFLPSNTNLSWNFSRGVLIVSVFSVAS